MRSPSRRLVMLTVSSASRHSGDSNQTLLVETQTISAQSRHEQCLLVVLESHLSVHLVHQQRYGGGASMQVDGVESLLGVAPLHVGNVSEGSLEGLNEVSGLESDGAVDLELGKLVGNQSLLSSSDRFDVEAHGRTMSTHEDLVAGLDGALADSAKDEVTGLDGNDVESRILAKRGHESLSEVLLGLLSWRDLEKRSDVLGREGEVGLQLGLAFKVLVDESSYVFEVRRLADPGDGLDLEKDKELGKSQNLGGHVALAQNNHVFAVRGEVDGGAVEDVERGVVVVVDFEPVGFLAGHVVASMKQVVDVRVCGASGGVADADGSGVLLVDDVGGSARNRLAVSHCHGHGVVVTRV